MSTQAPAQVQIFADTTLEKIAYNSVQTISTKEPNDKTRLGYYVWRWLKVKEGTLENAVRISGSRMQISISAATQIIREELKKHNVES
ncbi:MAG: hypothetical protein FJ218_03605 [Ignavibacteria bacterium]|nr:hypothetical protein [Ignavibacteria bacterium]